MVSLYTERDMMRRLVQTAREKAQSVALVPTMGGLHDGHLALVKQVLPLYDLVIVSIYINPTQFASGEDLDRYPRTLEADCAALAQCDDKICVFAPSSLYEPDNATMISVTGAALPLEGVYRPHFFNGVATAVFHLFQAVPADAAIFGEKDFQQLAVIRQMVRDLYLPITILQAPTMRADDGLALSSRNSYLSADERSRAPRLYQQMIICAKQVAEGIAPDVACDNAKTSLISQGFDRIDYFEWCDPVSLAPEITVQAQSRLLVGVWLGKTRLIDNDSFQNLCNAQ